MKSRLVKVLPLVAGVALGVAMPAQAADFVDTVSGASGTITTSAGVSSVDLTLNGANVKGSWNDTNNDGKFDTTETLIYLNVLDRDGGVAISAVAGSNRAALQTWGETNATTILKAFFPYGLSEITGVSDDNMMVSVSVSHNLFKKVEVLRKTQSAENRLSQDVKAEVEYVDLKVNGSKGSASSMVLGYSNEADSGLNFSVAVPYRHTSIKDQIDSKSDFVGLDLSLKYPVQKWEGGDWKVGGAIFGSAYYLKTNAIDQSGNLKYGAGLFTSSSKDLGFGTLGFGLDYRIAKAYLPSSMNSDNVFLAAAVDYVNDLDPVHTVSYGFNLGVPVAEDKAVNLEVVRSNFISSDIPTDQKNKTSVGLSGTYLVSDSFELNLGIRSDFEQKGIDTLGIMLGAVKTF